MRPLGEYIGSMAGESLGSVGSVGCVGWTLSGRVSSGTLHKISIRLGCGDFGSQASTFGTL